MRTARRWIVAGAICVVVGGAVGSAAALAPRWVKSAVVAKARARGLEATVSGVHVGWDRVRIDAIKVGLEGVEHVEAGATGIAIPWHFSGLGDDLTIDHVDVVADGPVDRLREEIDAWRERHRAASGGTGHGRTLHVSDVHFSWTRDGVEVANVSAGIDVDPEHVAAHRGTGVARIGRFSASTSGAELDWIRSSGAVGSMSLASLTLSVDESTGETAAPTLPSLIEPASALAPAGGATTTASTPTAVIPDASESAVWRTLGKLRAIIEHGRERFVQGSELRVERLTIGSARGTLGPWGAHVVLGDDATSFELLPNAGEGRKPIELRAIVPRDHGKWTAELKLGPATLAEIGVGEGAFGFVEVGKTTIDARGSIELDPDQTTFAADGEVKIHDGSFSHERVADGTVTGIELGVRGVLTSNGDFHAWTLTGGSFELGKLRLLIDGTIESTPPQKDGKPGTKLGARWSVPVVACSDALASLPNALVPKLTGMTMEGTFGARGSIAFDTRLLEKTELELSIDQHCRIVHAPAALAAEKFRGPFDLRVYDPSGKPGDIEQFGPGTPHWTPYERISPYVTDALLTCEDGAFFSHNGFSPMAIRNAIIANLKAGKFALGASTITMQLAKNVFLDRRKQLSRKVQEAVLTMWLEQSMSKSEILELYLNVIEFGPNLYGIGPASWHYFGRPANDLDPLEATFLVSILPAPVKRHAMWDAGAPSAYWTDYLRTLLREENKRGKIDETDLEAGLAETLVFHKPGMPTPPPHDIKQQGVNKLGDPNADFDPVWAPDDP